MNCQRTSISEWSRLFPGSSDVTKKYFVDLIAHYEEEHRYYHNMRHIEECLLQFDGVKHHCRNAAAVEIALWCHDVIYNTSRKDNEDKSAEWATGFMDEIKYDHDTAVMAADFIIATKDHLSREPDSQLLNDIDLSILGAYGERYTEYRYDIRREYKNVPDILYKNGRLKVLDHFLNMERIYQTECFRHLEEKARENIAKEINFLRGKV